VGGAHRNAEAVAATIKTALLKYLGELQQLPPDKLRAARNTRIDSFGVFSEVAS
jgi:acetyl-CoA carboxylase alpha subunit